MSLFMADQGEVKAEIKDIFKIGKKMKKTEKTSTKIALLVERFSIDLEQQCRKEQLKNSGLGKVIMFFSKFDEETAANRKLAKEGTSKGAGMSSQDPNFDLAEFSRQHASRPEAMSMDFVVRPQSKVEPDEVRARAKRVVQDQRHAKVGRKFQIKLSCTTI
ncbi:hypothetical protein RD792_001538 [Penstemon davidsonii]|uniref:TFIIS N-terminal domain-containing protein n=1 Tax=Penstemon davidsonii TaxID=160366 RepID=A0ABR0DPW7_9LAMI|nr:hypothetical protein RD792_001538 [Penstemon davidsonii]